MEEKAVQAVRWTVLTYAVGKVITLTATIVLARLLVPADFGVVMLAFVAVNVVGLFGDLGLGPTLVVRQDLDRRGLGTVLTMLLASGALLAVLLVAASPLLSRAFDEPRLGGVLAALAPLTVLGSLNWFYQWLLQRDLDFRSRFVGFVVQASVYAVVAVGAAALDAGVWSIVVGHLMGQLAMAVAYLRLAGPVRPRFDPPLARSLLGTSRGFLFQNTALLLQQNADYVAVGHTLGSTPLGFYSMAYRLSELPHLAVADPVTKVTFPAFSRMQQRGEDVRAHYLSVLRLVALVTWPLAAILSAAAGPLTRLVYGSRWVPMIGVLSVLALWGAAKSVQATIEWFLNSVGGAGAAGGVAIAVLVLQIPFLFLAADVGGIEAVGWTILAGVVVSATALVAFIRKRVGLGLGPHLRALWPPAGAALGAWLTARFISNGLDLNPAGACVAAAAVGSAVYVALVSAFAPGSVGMVWRQVRRTVAAPSRNLT